MCKIHQKWPKGLLAWDLGTMDEIVGFVCLFVCFASYTLDWVLEKLAIEKGQREYTKKPPGILISLVNGQEGVNLAREKTFRQYLPYPAKHHRTKPWSLPAPVSKLWVGSLEFHSPSVVMWHPSPPEGWIREYWVRSWDFSSLPGGMEAPLWGQWRPHGDPELSLPTSSKKLTFPLPFSIRGGWVWRWNFHHRQQ